MKQQSCCPGCWVTWKSCGRGKVTEWEPGSSARADVTSFTHFLSVSPTPALPEIWFLCHYFWKTSLFLLRSFPLAEPWVLNFSGMTVSSVCSRGEQSFPILLFRALVLSALMEKRYTRQTSPMRGTMSG